MRLLSFLLALTFALALSACGGTEDDPIAQADGGTMMDGSAGTGEAEFGAACGADGDCMSGACRQFNMLGMVCTILCTDNSMCPSASMGQKCNMNGFCRP